MTTGSTHQKAADFRDLMCGLPSPFAKVLTAVAGSLTDANFSSLKLLLISDDIFKKSILDKCKNAADLFVQLLHSGYLARKRLDFLSKLLIEIHRKDLARDLQEFQASEDRFLPENCSSTYNKSKTKWPAEQEEQYLLNCDRKESKTSLEDEFEMASSQESISDEEKLQKFNNYQSSDDFKMDI